MKEGTLIYFYWVADSEYSLVTTGRKCIRITTKDQCEKAAELLGMDDVEAATVTQTAYQEKHPPFCYYKPDESEVHRLRFNPNSEGTGNCSAARNCLCLTKEGKSSLKIGSLQLKKASPTR